ncbi:MAG: hypothetical protein Q8L13_19290, partial [Bradyrhizobium sp.]|uniref:hypothetical protein n=1 Tax=Bradyrhizobium sp. TaxID=376 RepID=UPI002730EC0C
SRRRAGGTFPLAALALGADQKSDAERDREIQKQGRQIEHSIPVRQVASASRTARRQHGRPTSSRRNRSMLMQIIAECAALWEAVPFATRRFARQKDR